MADIPWLRIADIALTVFHLLLILFNLLGWIWKPLRKLHLVTILLTLASWFVLGIWYGWGYCPFTDWHWNVLWQLGHSGLPSSYISFIIWRLTGVMPPEKWVDAITLLGALAALVMSVIMNFQLHKKLLKKHG